MRKREKQYKFSINQYSMQGWWWWEVKFVHSPVTIVTGYGLPITEQHQPIRTSQTVFQSNSQKSCRQHFHGPASLVLNGSFQQVTNWRPLACTPVFTSSTHPPNSAVHGYAAEEEHHVSSGGRAAVRKEPWMRLEI